MRYSIFRLTSGYRRYIYFSFTWLAGLVAGMFLAIQFTTIHNPWTQSLAYSRLSVIGFLASLSIPFLLSAILFRMSIFWLIIPLIFGKAFSYSFSVCVILITFADAGWLLCRLLVFSDSIVAVFLLWFWFRNLDMNNNCRQVDLLLCLVITLAIGCIDCCVISPFGISLLLHL